MDLEGETFHDALGYALSLKGHTFIHAYDDDLVIAGQGTVGLEVLEDSNGIDAILVPVGGGGARRCAAAAVKESSFKGQVVGVQSQAASSAFLSLNEGSVRSVVSLKTLADGIAVGRVGEKTFPVIQRYVDRMLLVREDAIAMAILFFIERESKFVVEGAGAVPLAALLERKEFFRGKRVVLIASGGNIDLTLVDRIIYRGLLTQRGGSSYSRLLPTTYRARCKRWRRSSLPTGAHTRRHP